MRRRQFVSLSVGLRWHRLARCRLIRAVQRLRWAVAPIRVVTELDLVVVATAGYYQDHTPRAFQVQSGNFRDILRALHLRADLEARRRTQRPAAPPKRYSSI